MSASVREPRDDQRIELGTAVSWPHIVAGACLLIVPAVIGLILLAGVFSSSDQSTAANRQEVAVVPVRQAAQIPVLAETPRGAEPHWPFQPPEELLPPRVVETVAERLAPPVERELLPRPAVAMAKPATVSPPAAVVAVPAASAERPQVATVSTPDFKRRLWLYESELQSILLNDVPELDIEKEKGTTKNLLTRKDTGATTKSPSPSPAVVNHEAFLSQIAQRTDLKGLPFHDADKCQASADQAKAMQKLSMDGRRFARLNRERTTGASESSQSSSHFRELQLTEYLDTKLTGGEWTEEAGLRLLVQMFQIEGPAVRMQIIKRLAESKAGNVGTTLAQRAVFDLSPVVREAAIAALKKRSAADYRPILLQSLRYPWPVVANHAAEALVALNDRQAIPDLTRLLDQPDPRAPYQNKEKKWVIAEMVRVNHFGNCVLCHAPATTRNDPVRGVVPERGERIPEMYYDGPSGSFVRADVTYLQQDFSVMQPVAEPKKWPSIQRFDYLIRERELSADEVKRFEARRQEPNGSYPQREAVLWAIRELERSAPGAR